MSDGEEALRWARSLCRVKARYLRVIARSHHTPERDRAAMFMAAQILSRGVGYEITRRITAIKKGADDAE